MRFKYLNELADIVVSIDESKNISDEKIVGLTDRSIRVIAHMKLLGLNVGALQEIFAGMQIMCGNRVVLIELIDMAHEEIAQLLGKDAWRVYGCDEGGWFIQVRIYDGASYLGNATVVGSNWSYADSRTLTDGQTVSYTARVADAVGNQSAAGTAYDVTIDTTAPVVAPLQSFTYAENQILAAVVANVVATDNNGVTSYRFSATGSQTSADTYFAINNSGEIRITTAGIAAGVAQNNFEITPNSFSYNVEARDAVGHWSTATAITLNVSDVIEVSPITITYPISSLVAENAVYTSTPLTLIGTPIGAVNYSLSGTDASLFTFNAGTGVVSMVARDFEAPADADGNNVYDYVLTATDDDGNTDTQAVAVTVTNQPEPLNLGVVSGINLNLIYGTTTSTGKSYYFLDSDGNNQAFFTDVTTHASLDALLNGFADTVDTQPGGAVAGVGAAYSRNRYQLGREYASLDAHGTSETTSLFATYPLMLSQTNSLWSTLTYENKKLNDRMDTVLTDTDKQVQLVSLGLSGERLDTVNGGGRNSIDATMYVGHLNMDATARMIDDLSTRSNGDFVKATYMLNRLQRITDQDTFSMTLFGQWAGKNLNSSEKYSLGGSYGVRAYPQGEASGDMGSMLNLELAHHFTPQLRGLVFYDYGHIRVNRDTYSMADNSRTLAGAGLGVNASLHSWQFDSYVAWPTQGGTPLSEPASAGRIPRLWVQMSGDF